MKIDTIGFERVSITNGQWQPPIWEDYRPAENTTAICTGPNAIQSCKSFLPQTRKPEHAGYMVPAAGIALNDVIEVCADYKDTCNTPVKWRRNMRVVAITPEAIEFDLYKTLAQALKAAKMEIEKRKTFSKLYVPMTRHKLVVSPVVHLPIGMTQHTPEGGAS